MTSVSVPHPFCSLCSPKKVCLFHRALDTAEKVRRISELFQRDGARAFARMIEAGFSSIEQAAYREHFLDVMESVSLKPLKQEFEKILDLDEFTARDLRRLAACALALAILGGQDDGTETEE